VALPATAATLLVPLLVQLVAGAPVRPAPPGAAGPAVEPADPRVNVGVRGSTGRTS
jgi:hypothetical protein